MDSLRLYGKYVAITIRSQMQYKASFFIMTIGHFMSTGVEILGVWAMFDRFGSLKGWSLPEVAFFYGLINIAFALAEMFGRGFDTFPAMVKSGEFDMILLRPRSTVLQIAGKEVQLMRLGRLSQGLIVLIIAGNVLEVSWHIGNIIQVVFALAGGCCLFYGLFIIQATLSFWTTETLEIMNILTYGGTEAGQYPLPIYRTWFRRFFTFIVPLAAISYFPALAVLNREDTVLQTGVFFQRAAPAIGIGFLVITLILWNFGVRHYRSTGS